MNFNERKRNCYKKKLKICMLELYMHNGACYFKLLHAVKKKCKLHRNIFKIETKLAHSKYINVYSIDSNALTYIVTIYFKKYYIDTNYYLIKIFYIKISVLSCLN